MREKALILWYYFWVRHGLRFSNRQRLERHQRRHLRRFQNKVLSKSPFYLKFKHLKIGSFPLMNKAKMMSVFDELNTKNLKLDLAMRFAQKGEATRDFSGNVAGLVIGLSSGTSGTRGLFTVDRLEQLKWVGAILAKTLPGSLFSRHRIAFFLRSNSELYESVNKSGRVSLTYFDLSLPFSEHLATLATLNPTQIIAPAHTLRALAEAKRAGILRVSPLRLTSVAEVLDLLDEQFIEETFRLPVHQIYQCAEGFLGCTCSERRLHLNEEFVIIEKHWIDEETKRFMPIVTDFTRTTQPIVRYLLDDVLVEDEEPCPCGSSTLVLKAIEGRRDDILYGLRPDSTFAPIFPDVLRHVAIRDTSLKDYALVQFGPETLSLSLCSSDENDWRTISDAFQSAFQLQGCLIPTVTRQSYEPSSPLKKFRRIERRFSPRRN